MKPASIRIARCAYDERGDCRIDGDICVGEKYCEFFNPVCPGCRQDGKLEQIVAGTAYFTCSRCGIEYKSDYPGYLPQEDADNDFDPDNEDT